jgi:hypothetical protein
LAMGCIGRGKVMPSSASFASIRPAISPLLQ